MIYEAIEPFGEKGADLRAGIIASVIANANRDPKRKPDAFKPADFMVNVPEASKPQWEKDLTMLKHLSAIHNANLKKEEEKK